MRDLKLEPGRCKLTFTGRKQLPPSSSAAGDGWTTLRSRHVACGSDARGRWCASGQVCAGAEHPSRRVAGVDEGACRMWSKMSVKRLALMGFWARMRFMVAMDGTKNL
jgi:hypothetical protein